MRTGRIGHGRRAATTGKRCDGVGAAKDAVSVRASGRCSGRRVGTEESYL